MTNQNRETLGRRIARMRLEHAMTQERLANIANVSAQAVSKWENDQSYPDILLLPLLAETFGVTVDELLGVEDAAVRTASAPSSASEPAPEPELESGLEPEPAPEPAPQPELERATDIDGPASHVRLRVIRAGRDAVNLTIPLAAARLVTNVASYFPERLIEGVDIAGLFQGAQNAGKGTLVDVDDDHDHVIITLE